MIKHLVKHGNSLALVIDKPILEMLRISDATPLQISSNGDALMLTPLRDQSRHKQLKASLDKINRKFGNDLKKLAQ